MMLILILLFCLPGCHKQAEEEPALPAPMVEQKEDINQPPAPTPQPRPTDHSHQPAEAFYSTGRYLWDNAGAISGTLTVNGQNYKTKNALPALNRLLPLTYDPAAVCACPAEYTYETKYGRFEVNLTEAFARCTEGQAALTASQCTALRQIFKSGTTTEGYEIPIYAGAIPLPAKPSTVIGHTHNPAETIRYAEGTPQDGICGNTEIDLMVEGYAYHMIGLDEAYFHLMELNYDQLRCGCPEEFSIYGESGIVYEINLTEAFARTRQGQTNLTRAQIDYFRALFNRQAATPPAK